MAFLVLSKLDKLRCALEIYCDITRSLMMNYLLNYAENINTSRLKATFVNNMKRKSLMFTLLSLLYKRSLYIKLRITNYNKLEFDVSGKDIYTIRYIANNSLHSRQHKVTSSNFLDYQQSFLLNSKRFEDIKSVIKNSQCNYNIWKCVFNIV